jgi:hypothetical protein
VPLLLSTLPYEEADALGWWWYLKQLLWRGRVWPLALQPWKLRGWAVLVRELLESATGKRTDPVRGLLHVSALGLARTQGGGIGAWAGPYVVRRSSRWGVCRLVEFGMVAELFALKQVITYAIRSTNNATQCVS